jgi:serine protein kinase
MLSNILTRLKTEQESRTEEEMSLEEFLHGCSTNPGYHATATERLLKAIGDPVLVDTSKDVRLGRIFFNRTISVYPAFSEFYGMEEVIERIVAFLRHSAQGLEESKQIMYLLGPVGGGKSSLAERLKVLMQVEPIYVLKHKGELSPIFESPLNLFPVTAAKDLEQEHGIPARKITGILSPWALKRLDSSKGDYSDFRVQKMYPSLLRQIGVAKVEPGDENNQDISTLVGKVDIRQLEDFKQSDPDAYSYSGGLNRANQGILEFVEMFKAPIKMLHPLITATQEKNYNGTENIGAIPFNGVIMAHSNEAEWATFKGNRNNEAFIDRVYLIRVPYCVRVTEEEMIYKKLINGSDLRDKPCAPSTTKMLAEWCVLTRLQKIDNGKLYNKMRVYDGVSLKETDPNAKSLQEYRDMVTGMEAMDGASTRFAFKVLAAVFNFDPREIAADPIHLMYVLEIAVKAEQYSEGVEKRYLEFIESELKPRFAEDLNKELNRAYLETYDDLGQNMFDRYIEFADHWIQDNDYKDPETGDMWKRDKLAEELDMIEKPALIPSPKEFRNEIVNYCLRIRSKNGGKNPHWNEYEKFREVLEKAMFGDMKKMLPVISFNKKKDSETEDKHNEFIERMKTRGYTPLMTRRLVEWFIRHQTNS